MLSATWQKPEPPRRGKRKMQEIKNEHQLRAEAMERIGTGLAACRKAAGADLASSADAVVTAVMENLASLEPGELPLAAQTIWTDRVARPLRADPTKPLSERDVGGLRSWPSARLGQFLAALAEIEVIVRDEEIDARNEIIRATISREYS